jgi:molybdopterin synthase catalytic subunit
MYHLTRDPIDVADVVASVGDSTAGATATFVGVTRDHNQGRVVKFLEYEAYADMAEQEMAGIGREAARRWSICKIAIVHRTGRVPIGQASVVIAVSAAHRAEAFAACRFAIDRLKASVPIWKKEHFEGGDVWIGQAPESEPAARGASSRG